MRVPELRWRDAATRRALCSRSLAFVPANGSLQRWHMTAMCLLHPSLIPTKDVRNDGDNA